MRTKTLLLLALAVVFGSSLAHGQAGVIGVYTDAVGSDCNFVETPGLLDVYVVHIGATGTLGSRWSAPKPGCMTGSSYIGESSPWSFVIGDSQTGISIGYGTCVSSPVHILTIQFLVTGSSPVCCSYPVLPDPAAPSGKIEAVDCSSNPLDPVGTFATINGDGSCPCGTVHTYDIPQSVVGGGGAGNMASTNYGMRGTVSQAAIGTGSSDSYESKIGYWYQPYSVVTGAETRPKLPKVYSLDQNYPNPFNPTTTIRFTLPKTSRVTLRVYDVRGSLVKTLIDKTMPAGVHQEVFDGRGLASGVYFYRMQSEHFVKTRKLILLK